MNESDRKSQEPYDFTDMCDIKMKATNDQTRQTKRLPKCIDSTTVGWLSEERGWGG